MANTTESLTPVPMEQAAPTRRRFLGWLIGGISAFVAATVGIPVIGAIGTAVAGKRKATSIRLDKLANYPIGEPRLSEFSITRTDGWLRAMESRAVWVLRKSDQEVTVFNGRCTHLGCAFTWRTKEPYSNHFVCPCHDGIFAIDGSVVSGPPPRALDTLEARIENGAVVVNYQDFRTGVPVKSSV